MDRITTRVVALGALAVAVGACTTPRATGVPIPSRTAVAVDDKRAFDACAHHYPNVVLATSTRAGDVRIFGPMPTRKHEGNFPVLPDDAYVAECLVPTSDGNVHDVWGVPDTGEPTKLWTQGGMGNTFIPPL